LDDELDLLAEHAASGVDLLGGDLGSVHDISSGRCECSGQRLVDADLDGLGHRAAGSSQHERGGNASRKYGSHFPLSSSRSDADRDDTPIIATPTTYTIILLLETVGQRLSAL